MNSHLVLTPTKREYPRHRATRPSRTQRFTLTYPVLQLRKHVICPLLSFVSLIQVQAMSSLQGEQTRDFIS
jgi:hypothetical protein